MNSFELHHAHYLSTTSYSWNVMLKFADVNLKLISDMESRLKGDISTTYKRYAEANNEFFNSRMLTKLHHISCTCRQ